MRGRGAIAIIGTVTLVACGRLGFSPVDDLATDGGDSSTSDAAPDTSLGPEVTETFGERSGTTHEGVTIDTFVSQMGGITTNYGGADNLRVELDEGALALIAFDVTALPAGAVIEAAELDLWTEVGVPGAVITLRNVTESWTEGNLDGGAGVASFSERHTGVAWSTAGAQPPGSAGTTVVATVEPAAVDSYIVSIDPAIVQSWLDSPAMNFGFVMSSSSGNTVRFVSSEGPSTQRPVLRVTYRQ